MSDKLRKYKSLYSSTCNTFSTGEGVTITPASVTGLPTDTEITLTFDRVDSSGTKTPSKMERIRGKVTGGNFVISSGGRAVEGTEQVHTSPVVEMIWNADDWNDTVDHILTEHNQDGTHKDTLVTSLKATGAEINTGASDATIVTPKAIADSAVSTASKTETLTNKTLTSPKINENVALTTTASKLNLFTNITTITGNDTNVVVGTKGSAGSVGYWNGDGDLVGTTIFAIDSGVTSCANSTATTIYTCTAPGFYMVSAYLAANEANNPYFGFAIVSVDGTTRNKIHVSNFGANINITMSNISVQVTQTSGVTQNIVWRIVRIG